MTSSVIVSLQLATDRFAFSLEYYAKGIHLCFLVALPKLSFSPYCTILSACLF